MPLRCQQPSRWGRRLRHPNTWVVEVPGKVDPTALQRILDAKKGAAMSLYAVVNPATGETVREYPTITDDELRAAIARADDTHDSWGASSSASERAALIRRVGELHVEKRKELAGIIVREMGKPFAQALGEVGFVGDIYGFYADNAEELMADEPIKLRAGDGSAVVRKSPLGVLLGIMPWNFPYYQA